jgi:SAM-dependent methyltransferase
MGDWWQHFFGGLWLEVQRNFRTPEQTRAEADFVEQALGLRPGDRVLDVPCGEGRIALELAARGHRVTGVDVTPALLVDARRAAAERGLSVAWEQRDMRDLPWQDRFDAAVCWWGSFGYFDDAGNAAFARAVARALRPGGRVLLDTPSAETLFPRQAQQPRSWTRVGEVLWLEEHRYEPATGRVESDWTFLRGGEVERRPISIRLYTLRELAQLLADAGFASWDAYGSLERGAFAVGSRRLYLVATKK